MSTVVIAAFGSRGDVAPFTGLGVRLRQAGHQVAIAACQPYAGLIRDAGLEYRWLPFDPSRGPRSEASRRYLDDGGSLRNVARLASDALEIMRGVGPAIADAAQDADILLTSVVSTTLGYHVAEGLGIPSAGVYALPTMPTGDFPPILADLPSLGRWGNRTMSKMMGLSERIYRGLVNELRRDLGLPPTTVRGILREQRERQWPILHGFSEHVVPRPRDWRPGLELTGYWWPQSPSSWEPPAELVDFLDAGPPPVFIGFGSNVVGLGDHYSELLIEAVRKAGVRGVVQADWDGLAAAGDDVIAIGEAPYEWLFPRMAALVHHAGSGTTAAGLRAGVPAVPVPNVVDQFLWAKRLVTLGLAPEKIRQKRLTADRLAAAIREVVGNPDYRLATQAMAAKLKDEDGAVPVIDLVNRLTSTTARH
ncbi:MAG TPA: glycosyltransferase [Amycolatopsis sp.]|nr:glycosyltransferase [Amycolatopsis sp.]